MIGYKGARGYFWYFPLGKGMAYVGAGDIDRKYVGISEFFQQNPSAKIIKKIGQTLAEDPEFKASIIEPLKMQGIDEFGDSGMVVRMKLKTRPGEQFTIRRKAYALIKKAFDENGIQFASPTVQVEGTGDAATAAAAKRAIDAAKPAPAAG